MISGAKQYHIEGLRGLAIILIVLFHMNAHWFPMGYLGVDVFLVISGYLLFLRPIQKEGQTKAQAAWGFVRRKCGRLMWPLSVAALMTMAVAYYMLIPGDLGSTFKTTRCALLGFSNVYLSNLKNGGYFAPDTSFNIMTPSWYLSLMCQVYLFFLAGWLLVSRKWVKAAVVCGIVLSFAYANLETVENWLGSLAGTQMHLFRRAPGYYSFGTRIWEVLAGGIVCALPSIRSGKMASLVSVGALALVLFLLFYPMEDQALAAPAMVAATVLCIRYGNGGFVKKALTNPVLLWFGKISFSMYLVHMCVVTSVLCLVCEMGAGCMAATFAGVVALAAVFYYTIERKRYPLYVTIPLWAVALAAAVFGSKMLKSNPTAYLWKDVELTEKTFPEWRFPADKGIYDHWDAKTLKTNTHLVAVLTNQSSWAETPFLNMGDRDDVKPGFVLFGDSHAAALFSGLNEFSRKHGLSGVYLTTYVVPLDNWHFGGEETPWSPQHVAALMRWLEAHPEIRTVIVANRWKIRWQTLQASAYHSHCGDDVPTALRKFIIKLNQAGKKVIVSTCVPELTTHSPVRSYYYYKRFGSEANRRNLDYDRRDYEAEMKGYNAFLASMEKEGLCSLLHVEDALFKDGKFAVIENKCAMLIDQNHLSSFGAEKVANHHEAFLLEYLQGGGKTEAAAQAEAETKD